MKTQEQILKERLKKRFRKALTEFSMISDGDRVLVGLSGGKDSLCLLELLSERMKITCPQFFVEAIHIRMSNINYESDTGYLERFAKDCGVRLHILTTGFEEQADSNKPACFLCSWHRRKILFRYAQDNGFNKIALGHHMDDMIHTAMLNQFYEGKFSTMPVVLEMEKMPLTIIRPLCMEHESDLSEYSQMRKYEKQLKICPFETISNRNAMRQIFKQIEELNPEARYSMWHALKDDGKLEQRKAKL